MSSVSAEYRQQSRHSFSSLKDESLMKGDAAVKTPYIAV
jgi:hypothetical protein